MGTIFPNDPEFPDYVPFPSLFLEAARASLLPMLVASLLLASWDHGDHPHAHSEPFVLMPPVVPPPPPDEVPLGWMNSSSMDTANDIVIHRAVAQRNAQMLMAGISSMSSPAVLLTSIER